MKNGRIRALGVIEVESPEFEKVYNSLLDVAFFLNLCYYHPDKRKQHLDFASHAAAKLAVSVGELANNESL